ncbi:uncharacterized protein [Rutidosis leptorrhynchoides]|uniref:uncharacterized protein n=1 Tax=Rutidosis leptorrhynchoides TaxID=125765 RepID=UPI003A9A5BC1
MASKLIINKYLVTPTPPSTSLCSTFTAGRRKLHESAYEKEVEDVVELEDQVEVEEISHKPEEYWEPDPDSGVFVPSNEENAIETCTTEETVLDEHAFYRQKEDIEAPLPESFTGVIPPVDPFAE